MHGLLRQVSMTQVAPAEQWLMKQAIWQVPKLQSEPGPHSLMLQPPPVQVSKRQTALVPAQFMTHPPEHLSMAQLLPSPQAPIWQPPLQMPR
jgi:hypothetical protein